MKKLILLVLLILVLSGCTPRDIYVELNEGYDIIGVNEVWEDSGCTLHINSDFEIMMGVSASEIDITTPGEYRVDYLEEYGNVEYTCLRIVKVVDEEGPVVALNAGIDTILVSEVWIDSGVTITDNFDTDLEAVVSGTVQNEIVGSYEIIYTITDSSGNVTEISRIVNVIE